jgi:hypothetical protein
VAKLADFGAAVHVTAGKLQTRGRSHHVPNWFPKYPFAADAYAISWVLLDILSLEHEDPTFRKFDYLEVEDLLDRRLATVETLLPQCAHLELRSCSASTRKLLCHCR